MCHLYRINILWPSLRALNPQSRWSTRNRQNAFSTFSEASPKVGSCKPGDVDSYAGIIHKDKELAEQLGVVNGFGFHVPFIGHGIQRCGFKMIQTRFQCNVVIQATFFFWWVSTSSSSIFVSARAAGAWTMFVGTIALIWKADGSLEERRRSLRNPMGFWVIWVVLSSWMMVDMISGKHHRCGMLGIYIYTWWSTLVDLC